MSVCFLFDYWFYEWDGVAMGSLLSRVIAGYYREHCEAEELDAGACKHSCWFWYLDDAFAICLLGPHKLNTFLCHLNSSPPYIQRSLAIPEHLHLQ
jgi:hypothetical protein